MVTQQLEGELHKYVRLEPSTLRILENLAQVRGESSLPGLVAKSLSIHAYILAHTRAGAELSIKMPDGTAIPLIIE